MRRFNTWGLVALAGCGARPMPPSRSAVEEVIVTATRRAQEVQDVPASVAVVDPQAFAAGGLTSLSGVLKYVPGVNFNDDGAPGQGSITMRGVANIFSTPSVGIYLDDIPYGSVTAFAEGANFALDSLLGNVERIEVIKGPQGTLFGAASMGGSLRYITKEPSLTDFGGRFATDLSDTLEGGFNQLYKAGIDVPIVNDKLALGVSGFYQDNDGFIDQAVRPDKDVNDAQLRGGQATLLFRPSEPWKIKLNYQDQKFEFTGPNAVPFNITTGEPVFGRYKQNTAGEEPTEIEFELSSATIEYQGGWGTADAGEQLPGVLAGRDRRPDALLRRARRCAGRRTAGNQHGAARFADLHRPLGARVPPDLGEQRAPRMARSACTTRRRRARTSRAPSRGRAASISSRSSSRPTTRRRRRSAT